MATSLLSRRLLSGRLRLPYPSFRPFSNSPDLDPDTFTSPDPTPAPQARNYEPRQLEGGMDPGLYKAILVGKVGQEPMKRSLRSGLEIVLFSLATGGIRNNRRPLPHEQADVYANRCAVQWHRVCVYSPRLNPIAMDIVKPGAVIYLEGNIETKVFADPATGLVRRVREIAIRTDGRLLNLGTDEEGPKLDNFTRRAVGYY